MYHSLDYLIIKVESHLIDVRVPHLGEEPEGRRRIWIIYRELDSSLFKRVRVKKSDKLRHTHCYKDCTHNMTLCITFI